MKPLSIRLRALLRRRSTLVFLGVWTVLAGVVCAAPLAGAPGFANALGTNLLVGTLGLWAGVLAARLEQDIAGHLPVPGLPLSLRRAERPAGAVLQVFAVGLVLTLVGLALSLVAALVSGLFQGTCDLLRDLVWYPVLPLGSAPLAVALGITIGASTRGWRGAWLWSVLVIAAFGLATAWPILTGPQAFAFNHLLGWAPGPFYDERAAITSSLLLYRGLTIVWAVAVLGGLSITLARGSFSLGAPRATPGPWAVTGLAGALLLAGFLGRHDLGHAQSFESVADALGGEVTTDSLVIHYPKERDEAWVARTVADHELALARLLKFFDLPAPSQPIHSYVFRSTDEKAHFTGAGNTSIAKPWLSAIFVDDRGHPHPVLVHELAHALAAEFGRGPFAVSGNGLVMNTGLVEGLAVAADWRVDDLTVHEWSRAMRAVGVAPDVRGLLTTTGFWRQSSGRAYTLAGSFVRFLVDTRGIETVKAAYQSGDLSVIDAPETLFRAWEAFLDSAPPPPLAVRLAEHRFQQPSIFHRPCAFDVTRARQRAHQALGRRRFDEARRHFGRCVELEPQDPLHLKGLFDVALAETDLDEANALATRILAHEKTSARLRNTLQNQLGDLAWKAGDPVEARRHFDAVLAEAADAYLLRLVTAKTQALERARPDPEACQLDPACVVAGRVLRPLLLGELSGPAAVLRLVEALERTPGAPLLAYLLGRQLFNARDWSGAIRYFAAARDWGLTADGGLAQENLRLLARAAWEKGDAALCTKAWTAYGKHPSISEGPRDRTEVWLSRCAQLANTDLARR